MLSRQLIKLRLRLEEPTGYFEDAEEIMHRIMSFKEFGATEK